MKKLTALLLTFLMIISTAATALADTADVTEPAEGTEEQIKYAVSLLNERLYYNRTPDCYPLDIAPYCNRAFADEVSGDGLGGWSDQGPTNDLASFDLRGKVYLCNIPFNIVSPETNDNKSAIVLRGQNDKNFPLSVEIPVNDVAEGMYVLHGAAWNSVNPLGKYGFVYEDGTSAMFEISGSTHIADFWGTTNNDYMRTAWTGSNPSSSIISLNVFALNNPHPEKKIKSVKLLSYGSIAYLGIVGITMARTGLCFPLNSSVANVTMKASSINMWPTSSPMKESDFDNTLLDSSEYLDAPAGKHGVLKAEGESLVFADGTKAKLWGTNIAGEACYPDKSSAEDMASRIARCGYNLVRFVNMDQTELSEERLGRLAYFQSLLKAKGIYSYFSLLGNAPGDGDDIADGWKIEGLFDDALIEKQRLFAKTLLTYKNGYTGMTFAEDPSLIMIDLADQNTMFDYKFGDSYLALKTEKYKNQLQEKFNSYLKEKYKTTDALKRKWSVVYDDEKIEDGTVVINGNWKYGLFSDDVRRADVYEFFGSLQEEHYKALSAVIREAGFEGLISGVTNRWNNVTPYNSYSQSIYADFLPINGIGANAFEHNKLEDGLWNATYDPILSGDRHDGNEFLDFAENRVAGIPYVISEWGTSLLSPNPYEAPVLMSVLAAQQNWTPIQYCFVYDKINTEKYEDLYSAYSNPVQLALAQLSAALYYNTGELESGSTYNFNKSYLYNDKNLNNGATPNIQRTFKTPVFKNYYGKKTNVKFTNAATDTCKADADIYSTSNSNMHIDLIDGQFFTQNSKALAYVGKVSAVEKIGRLAFDVYTGNAFVGLISKDGKDIDDSERMLFMVGGRTLNKGMDMSDVKVLSVGEAAIVYENVIADITVDNAAGYKVYALDEYGNRLTEVSSRSNADGSITFTTNFGVSAINYEIVKED